MKLFLVPALLMLFSCGNPIKANKDDLPVNTTANRKTELNRIRYSDLAEKLNRFYFNGRPFTGSLVDTFVNDNILIASFINGEKDGIWEGKNLDGTTNFKRSYRNGVQHGMYELFSNGRMQERGNYREGVLDGKFETFLDNGAVAQSGNYTGGKKTDEWYEYYSNNSIKQRSTYIGGELDSWEAYNEEGKMWKRMYPKQNGLNKIEEYYPPIDGPLTSRPTMGQVKEALTSTGSADLVNYIVQQEAIHQYIQKGYSKAYGDYLNTGAEYNFRRLRKAIEEDYPDKIKALQAYIAENRAQIGQTPGLEERYQKLLRDYQDLFKAAFEN